jgi:hypothetical protein
MKSARDASPIGGRIYEDTSASAPDMRWSWSIAVDVWPDAGITTSGTAPTLDQAEFQRNWIAWSKQAV